MVGDVQTHQLAFPFQLLTRVGGGGAGQFNRLLHACHAKEGHLPAQSRPLVVGGNRQDAVECRQQRQPRTK